MRVGILSMQRVNNYGSFWQAYCLKKMIEEEGHSVEFIDIWPGKPETINEYKTKFALSKILRVPYYLFQYKKNRIFDEWKRRELGLPDKFNYKDDYDAILIGSDEVFNCAQKSSWGCSLQLFGNIDNPNVNTYAASFGSTNREYILKSNLRTDISASLKNIRNISVRDDNSLNLVKWMTDRMPEVHFDPVIVGELPIGIEEVNAEAFILIYSYDYRFSDPSIISQIRKIADSKNLKVYSIGFYQNWVDKNIAPTPVELLAYFKKAKYVITDTYHGTIFSVRFYKRFATVVLETNKNKLQDLIVRLGIEDHQYTLEKDIYEVLCSSPIDYQFEEKRSEWKRQSMNYLKKCIGRTT